MPESRFPRLRRVGTIANSVRVRVLLALGLVVGFAAVGTMAYWSDTAVFETGSIQAGSLDLQLGGRDPATGNVEWSAVGLNKDWQYSVLQLDNVSPGESVAMELHVRNIGSTPLTFTGLGRATTDEMGQYLTASTWLGGTASNTGTREAVARTGSCTPGTAQWWNNHPLTPAPTEVRPGNAPYRLDPNQSIQVCIVAGLSSATPNSFQGASTTIEVSLEAKQVGAP